MRTLQVPLCLSTGPARADPAAVNPPARAAKRIADIIAKGCPGLGRTRPPVSGLGVIERLPEDREGVATGKDERGHACPLQRVVGVARAARDVDRPAASLPQPFDSRKGLCLIDFIR